jgi:hypothetical protein
MNKTTRHYAKKPIDDAKLKRLWVSHMTECNIAKEMGHHRNTLRRRAAKLGMPLRRKIWAKEKVR